MGTHHVWQCNAYEDDVGKEKAKTDLERYIHYYTRYKGHNDAQIFAERELMRAEGKLMTSKGEKITELPDYLKEANGQLVQCRRVLKHTYIYAYYQFLDQGKKLAKERFEYHQGLLEGMTEELSKATEKPLIEIDKQDVVNRTRAIGEFIKNVLSYVAEEIDGSLRMGF